MVGALRFELRTPCSQNRNAYIEQIIDKKALATSWESANLLNSVETATS